MTQSAPDTFAAFVGIDWADAKHDVCLQAAGSSKRACFQLEHTPEAIDAWVTTLRTRFNGSPIAVCLELNTGPLVFAWRTYDLLILFPLNPLTLARYREAARPVGPKMTPPMPHSSSNCCAPIATSCSLSIHKALPCAPSSSSSNIVAVWSATQCGSPIASRAP